jgi:hypothetical protein
MTTRTERRHRGLSFVLCSIDRATWDAICVEHAGLKHLMPRGPVPAEKEDVISTKGEGAEVGHGLFLDEGQRSLGQFMTSMDEAWVLGFCGREA